jgi:phosphoribosyl 1,2-cyclic phosphodiesterase
MEVTFWGVRGSIPAPGPATIRYGGNTSCVSVRLSDGQLVIFDCGTGARNLGNALMATEFGSGAGHATFLLSLAQWDHIQGFPFFVPFYVTGNRFSVFGGTRDPKELETILEGQMAAQYFPVQTIRNMAAGLELGALPQVGALSIGGARLTAVRSQPGPQGALSFRLEENGTSLVYAGHAGYGKGGPSPETVALCADATLLIHETTFTPEDFARYSNRGLTSLAQAIDCAIAARVKRLALFHYDQDYTDNDVDALVDRARRMLAERDAAIEVVGAAERLTLQV